jgi:hypothetical protein
LDSSTALARAEKVLTPKEREAYQKYVEANKPPLAVSTAANFFALFLQGHTCEEIAKLNPAFGLGIIVRARIDNDWDTARDEHLEHLMANIRQVAQAKQLGSIRFVSTALAAFERMAGEKFQRYLQTGDITQLGEWKDMNFKQYKELIELILKLTGQENSTTKKVTGDVLHRHVVEDSAQPITVRADRPMTVVEADSMLKRLDDGLKGKK